MSRPLFVLLIPIVNQVYQRHADLGYVAAAIYPMSKENTGGVTLPGKVPAESWNAFHDLILMDEIARIGYLGVIWGLGCGNVIGCPPLINYGTPEQKQKFLPPVIRGRSRFCLGITEPDGTCFFSPKAAADDFADMLCAFQLDPMWLI